MYKRILIATDGSPLSDKAVESGLSLAALTGASVVALKVVPRYPRSYFEGGMPVDASDVKRIEGQWGDAAQAMVDAVKAQGAAQGVTVKAVTAKSDLVAEAAVVGAPDAEWGEVVVAFIVGCADECALDAHLLERIARFKRPKRYVVVEELPKNRYGKVLKRELRERLVQPLT